MKKILLLLFLIPAFAMAQSDADNQTAIDSLKTNTAKKNNATFLWRLYKGLNDSKVNKDSVLQYSKDSVIAIIKDKTWVDLTLIDGWAAGSRTPQYAILSNGLVIFRGLLNASAVSAIAVTGNTPAIAPSQAMELRINKSGVDNTNYQMNITALGSIQIPSIGTGTAIILCLDGISYPLQ